MKNRRIILDHLIITALATFMCRGLFKTGWLAGHDSLTGLVYLKYFHDAIKFYHEIPIVYQNWFCGYNEMYIWGGELPIMLLGFLTYLFESNIELLIKIYTFFIVVLSGFSMYHLSRHLTYNNNASLVAAMCYMLNPYMYPVLLIYEAHRSIALGFALLPLLLTTIFKVTENSNMKRIFISSIMISLFINSVYNGYVNFTIWILIMYTIYIFVILLARKQKKLIFNIIKIYVVIFIITFLLSLYQILPLMQRITAASISIPKFSVSDFKWFSCKNLLTAITLNAKKPSCCAPNTYLGILGQDSIFFEVFLIVLSTLSLLFKKKKYSLFFSILMIVSIYLSKGANPPFEGFAIWIFENVPFFSSVRVGARYTIGTQISKSALLAISLSEISDKISSKGNLIRKRLKSISILLFPILMSIFYIWIPLTTSFYTFHPPEVYLNLYNEILKNKPSGRILAYPIKSYIPPQITETALVDLNLIIPAYYGGSVVWGTGMPPRLLEDYLRQINKIIKSRNTEHLGELLSIIGVEYIVVDTNYTVNINYFRKQKDLKELFNYKNFVVFYNEAFKGKIFIANCSGSATILQYNEVTPTRIIVHINASEPFILAFSTNYDNMWVAYVNGEEIKSFPLYNVINGFSVNKTGLLQIIIEYKLQKMFYLGFIISILTLVSILILLLKWGD